MTCFSQFLWPERWSASLLCFFTVPHNWCCLQNKGNRETRKKNKGISSHSLDHRGPFFQFLFPRTQSSLGVKVTSSQWWQCNAMTKAGPESGVEEETCKKWEKRNLLHTFWKAGVPFPDPLDRKRWFLPGFLSTLAAQLLMSACPQFKARSQKREKEKTKKTPKPWNSFLLQFVNQVLTSVPVSCIVYFSEPSSNYLVYAVQSFSCDQWDRPLSTYPILASMGISVKHISLSKQQGAI